MSSHNCRCYKCNCGYKCNRYIYQCNKYICNKCGHIAIIDRHGGLHCAICEDNAEINPVEMSYAFKLLIDELKSLVIAPRIKLETLV